MANNNKKRSTRRAFGRRALAFGVAMFAMVTLTAVGFAAWLISSDATNQSTGGIVTQQVSRADIKIKVENLANGKLVDAEGKEYKISFAPNKNNGVLAWDGADDPENLKFSFNGTVSNWDRVGELSFSVRVPDSVAIAAGYIRSEKDGVTTWTYDAANAYIALPACAMDKDGNAFPLVTNSVVDETGKTTTTAATTTGTTAPIVFKNDDTFTSPANQGVITVTKRDTNAEFVGVDLSFGWGAKYNYKNPSEFFSKDADKAALIKTNTGVEMDKVYYADQINLEMIKQQAIVNSVALDTLYSEVKLAGDDTTTLQDAITALGTGKTIDDFVKSDNAQVTAWLEALQAHLLTKIAAPQYTLYIQAIVK